MQATPFITTQESFSGSIYGYHDPMRSYAIKSDPISIHSSNRVYSDGDNGIQFAHPSLPPYVTTAVPRSTMAAVESVSPFGMTQLHSSLPGAYVDRQLPPVPSGSGRSSIASASAQDQALMRSHSHGTGLNNLNTHIRYTKEAMEWDNHATEGRHSFSGTTGEVMGPPASRSVVSTATDNAVLGYIPITGSPEPSPTTAPSLSYSSTATSTPAPASHRVSLSHGLPSTIASDYPSLERSDSATALYTLSSAANPKRNSTDYSAADGSTLVSGQHYAPLMQPQPQHMASFEALRTSSISGQRPSSSYEGAGSKAHPG